MAVPGGQGPLLILLFFLHGSRLDATRYGKSLRQAPDACEAWGRVLQRGQDDPILDAREVGYNVLRLARVRLHAMQCLLWRQFFSMHVADDIDLVIFSDGSPQWRGVEMLASSFDLRVFGPAQLISEKKLVMFWF